MKIISNSPGDARHFLENLKGLKEEIGCPS
jgi:hypothetical protein